MEFNKDLIAASSTPIVLAILTEGDSYGYAIIKRVQELSSGHMEWTDGMLYPVLHRLERLGYIKARWEESETGRKRKYYRITAKGKGQLEEERKQWQAVDATLRGLWKRETRIRTNLSSEPRVAFSRLASIGFPGAAFVSIALAALEALTGYDCHKGHKEWMMNIVQSPPRVLCACLR